MKMRYSLHDEAILKLASCPYHPPLARSHLLSPCRTRRLAAEEAAEGERGRRKEGGQPTRGTAALPPRRRSFARGAVRSGRSSLACQADRVIRKKSRRPSSPAPSAVTASVNAMMTAT